MDYIFTILNVVIFFHINKYTICRNKDTNITNIRLVLIGRLREFTLSFNFQFICKS